MGQDESSVEMQNINDIISYVKQFQQKINPKLQFDPQHVVLTVYTDDNPIYIFQGYNMVLFDEFVRNESLLYIAPDYMMNNELQDLIYNVTTFGNEKIKFYDEKYFREGIPPTYMSFHLDIEGKYPRCDTARDWLNKQKSL
jgi:hypothetical protein